MGVGAFAEPLIVVTLLFGGTWVNRNRNYRLFARRHSRVEKAYSEWNRSGSPDGSDSAVSSDNLIDNEDLRPLPSRRSHEPTWRRRKFGVLGFSTEVLSPNTRRYKDYFLSRLLLRFPFLVEAWYWALIYWVYQLGRAFTAVTLVEGTVHVARKHALQLVQLEQRLRIFIEPSFQQFFLQYPQLMHWINRIYSFIHIPGTIFFLVWLYWYTTTPSHSRTPDRDAHKHLHEPAGRQPLSAGPALYEARRRTMAMCNLLAFLVFTAWPCMPPRLLSDPNYKGPMAEQARSYGFVDTVHGAAGESSVWTQNRFCNQYAAMPSLHFGYSLLIGLTIATIPLSPTSAHHHTHRLLPRALRPLTAPKRLVCIALGAAYALTILVAIVATANHFVLDAVAGALVCALAWCGNGLLLNLCVVEDWFLAGVRIHKPVRGEEGLEGDD